MVTWGKGGGGGGGRKRPYVVNVVYGRPRYLFKLPILKYMFFHYRLTFGPHISKVPGAVQDATILFEVRKSKNMW